MNILGIDFEDWYHPQLIQPYITTEKKSTMFQGMDRILELLNKNDTSATFFLVGLATTLTRSMMITFWDVLPVYILMAIAIYMMVYEAFFDKS